jgi:hypothetical protein
MEISEARAESRAKLLVGQNAEKKPSLSEMSRCMRLQLASGATERSDFVYFLQLSTAVRPLLVET